jgi:hypothetical protein
MPASMSFGRPSPRKGAVKSPDSCGNPEKRNQTSWAPGVSGNPRGRPPAEFDVAAAAREHGAHCLAVAVELLNDPDPRIRLAALVAILDRGFGRPTQMIAATNDSTSPIVLFYEAATTVSAELRAESEQRAINGHAVPQNGSANARDGNSRVVDLLAAPLPTE